MLTLPTLPALTPIVPRSRVGGIAVNFTIQWRADPTFTWRAVAYDSTKIGAGRTATAFRNREGGEVRIIDESM